MVRGRTVEMMTTCRARMRHVVVLMAQGQPTLLIMQLIMMGKTTILAELPVTMMPIAAPRF